MMKPVLGNPPIPAAIFPVPSSSGNSSVQLRGVYLSIPCSGEDISILALERGVKVVSIADGRKFSGQSNTVWNGA